MDTRAVFTSSLVDESGQPNLVKDSHELFWTLVNTQAADLVVTHFTSGKVDENQYHFEIDFSPAALTSTPTLPGWDVYPVKDTNGAISSLYIALSGGKDLTIKAHQSHKVTFFYTGTIQEQPNISDIDVTVTIGQNVKVGNQDQEDQSYGFKLTLVQGNTPTMSVPPLTIDVVGPRTVLNDGHFSNSFTFALTNMTGADLDLTPDVQFTVWFDAAPKQATGYPGALATTDKLSFMSLPPPSADWTINPPVADQKKDTPPVIPAVSPQWTMKTKTKVPFKKHEPILFEFKNLRTALDPGFTRMYLKFEGFPGFRPGVVSAVLEKTPFGYGPTQGKGMYLSVGTSKANTPPDPNYDGGLFVNQFDDRPAAIFNAQNTGGGTLILGSEKPNEASLRFGLKPGYAWVQSQSKPLVINPSPGNVGIGLEDPGSRLSVDGGVAIGKGFAKHDNLIGQNNLAVEGKVGIGTTTPGSSLSVNGGVAIGKSFVDKDTLVGQNYLAVEGRIGIGTVTPGSSLSVDGGVAIGKGFANKDTLIGQNNLAVEGRIGINKTTPDCPLHVNLKGMGGGQLLVTANNDKSVQLVAAAPEGSSDASADFMYLGGSADPNKAIRKLELNAKEVDIQAPTTTVQGKLNAAGLASTGGLKISGKGTDDKYVLALGVGVDGKDGDAGKIAYQGWSSGLDIVGAGNEAGKREIHLWDQTYVRGNLWVECGDGAGGTSWCSLAANDNLVKKNNWNYATFNYSDVRLKKDLTRIKSPLESVRKLSGCVYDWTEEALNLFTKEVGTNLSAGPDATAEETEALRQAQREKLYKNLARPQVGVLAQDVEAVLPEAVTTGEDGYKSVNYHQLIPLLIEAIKEQDGAITAQAKLVAQQQIEIEQLKQALRLNSRPLIATTAS